MAELVHQTWTRITGKPWSAAAAGGYTTGTASANIALQKKLLGGWNPYAKPAPKPAPKPAAAPKAQTGVAAAEQQVAGIEAGMQAGLGQTQQQIGATTAEQQAWIDQLKDLPVPKVGAITEELWGEFKIPEQYEQLLGHVAGMEAALNEINQLNAQMNEALLGSEQRMAPMTFIRGEQALIERQFGIKIANATAVANAHAAIMEAIRGNMGVARNFINDMVQAKIYEYQLNVDKIKDFIGINETILSRLTGKEQNLINNLLGIAQDRLNRARMEADMIGQLMVSYPTANINPNMTLEQAFSAAQIGAHEQLMWERSIEQQRLATSGAGLPGAGPEAGENEISYWAKKISEASDICPPDKPNCESTPRDMVISQMYDSVSEKGNITKILIKVKPYTGTAPAPEEAIDRRPFLGTAPEEAYGWFQRASRWFLSKRSKWSIK